MYILIRKNEMATVPNIYVPSDSYLDLYQAVNEVIDGSISVGDSLQIFNKGCTFLYAQEGDTQPDSTSTDGLPITRMFESNPILLVGDGSDKIWLRSVGSYGLINVEIM